METLLWLAELLAMAEGERLVFRCVVVTQADSNRIVETACGETFPRARHDSDTNIKAVTFHQLDITEDGEGWQVQVFLDLWGEPF